MTSSMTDKPQEKPQVALEERINEAMYLIHSLTQIVSTLMIGFTLVLENHEHDEDGNIVLPDWLEHTYETVVKEPLRAYAMNMDLGEKE